MNFARDVLDRLPPGQRALVELARDGSRREWSFGEVSEHSARLAGALARRGVGRGDVVMTLIGNRPEWVLTMLACFRLGAVVLPCTEQLRAKDLRLRLAVARPRLVVADERNRGELEAALGTASRCGTIAPRGRRPRSRSHAGSRAPRGGAPIAPRWKQRTGSHRETVEVVLVPDNSLFDAAPAPAVELADEDPCLITFTSGTAGEPKAVLHGQRYLLGQRLQATHWLGARTGELVWCTAASGWSKSARNVFIAPWLSGAAALLHDARFDPAERLEVLARERVNVLCQAPTEYRVIAKRATLAAAARPARGGRRRGGAQPCGAARVAGGHRPVHPRRVRADRDRTAHGGAAGRGAPPGVDGTRAARGAAHRRGRRAGRRPRERAHVLPRVPRRGRPARSGRALA